MNNHRYQATLVLVIVAAGFAASYHLRGSFGGGLLFSGCFAALVGGLADWFGVTALFRKPLGISFRTAVIPRNRQRLFNEMITLVETDLLSKQHIIDKIQQYRISEILLQYLEQEGKRDTKEITLSLVHDILNKINPDEIGEMIERLIKGNAGTVKISPMMASAVEWTMQHGYSDKVIDFILDELYKALDQRQVQDLLNDFLSAVIDQYEGDMVRRKLFDGFADIHSLSLQRQLISLLQQQILAVKDRSHWIRAKLNAWLDGIIIELRENPRVQQPVEDWKLKVIQEHLRIAILAAKFLRHIRQTAASGPVHDVIIQQLDKLIDVGIDNFRRNREQQDKVDVFIKKRLVGLIDRYHGRIGWLVKEKLDCFSDQSLVEFLETKVGDDLQMIRINGTIVGGLTGAFLYCVTYLLERVWL